MTLIAPLSLLPRFIGKPAQLVPGLALCAAIVLVVEGLGLLQALLLGRQWIDGLVLAIILGALVRPAVRPRRAFRRGIAFSGKTLLEVGIVLLGTTIGAGTLIGLGPLLPALIAALVLGAIVVSYGLGRALGLGRDLALLIACGNAICGNSAIAAIAPVLRARPADVAAAISFTAVLGAGYVLVLPALAFVLGLDERDAGLFAGLTVYAVPQVLAAAAPIGLIAVQIGTLTKLVRVLMLGPVVLVLALMRRDGASAGQLRLGRLVPWFILGFLAVVGLRSAGILPLWLQHPAAELSGVLTTMAMAALGLGVDLRDVTRAGGRAALVAALSLVVIAVLALLVAGMVGT